MNIIIVGHGKVGSAIAENLVADKHRVTAIENRNEVIASLPRELPYRVIKGNGACIDVLNAADVKNADMLIAATPNDELNIISCVTAKRLGAKRTVARVRSPEYASQIKFMHDEFGLTFSINPDNSAAREIADIVHFPSAAKIDMFAGGLAELVEYTIPRESELIDLPLFEICKRYNVKVLICFVQREDKTFIPKGNFKLMAGDKIAVASDTQNIIAFFGLLNAGKKPIRTVTIAGGGRIPHYLIQKLADLNLNITVIEANAKTVEKLRASYPDLKIINTDPTDKEELMKFGAAGSDAFIALTEVDEENIIISMHAKNLGCGKIIAATDEPNYSGILEDSGIDSIIMPKMITADRILQFVRATENAKDSSLETLYSLANGTAEALAFAIKEEFEYTDIPLKDLKLKDNILIGSVIRDNKNIVPDGNTVIMPGDRLIVITTEKGLKDAEDIVKA